MPRVLVMPYGTMPRIPPILPQPSQAPTGYVGFGSLTLGADSAPGGATPYVVTSLADSGPGTYRDAISVSGRYITFAVGGTITLASSAVITRQSYLTIDGSTAPSPGITILQPSILTNTGIEPDPGFPCHDIIVKYIRFVGPNPGTTNQNKGDLWHLDGTGDRIDRVIHDHLTLDGASDGIFDRTGDTSDLTFSNCILMRTDVAANSVRSSGGSINAKRQRETWWRCLFMRNSDRQPRLAGSTPFIDFVNCITYGWQWINTIKGSFICQDNADGNPMDLRMNVENSLFLCPNVNGLGQGQTAQDKCFYWEQLPGQFIYFNGNVHPPLEADMVSNSAQIPIDPYAIVPHDQAFQLRSLVLPTVGTKNRTALEQQFIDEVDNYSGP